MGRGIGRCDKAIRGTFYWRWEGELGGGGGGKGGGWLMIAGGMGGGGGMGRGEALSLK